MATFDFARVGFEAFNAARDRRLRAQIEAQRTREAIERQRVLDERLRLAQAAARRAETLQAREEARRVMEERRLQQIRKTPLTDIFEPEAVKGIFQPGATLGDVEEAGGLSSVIAQTQRFRDRGARGTDPTLEFNRLSDQISDLESETADLIFVQQKMQEVRERAGALQQETPGEEPGFLGRLFGSEPEPVPGLPANEAEAAARGEALSGLSASQKATFERLSRVPDLERRITDRQRQIESLRRRLGLGNGQAQSTSQGATELTPEELLERARQVRQARQQPFDASAALERRVRNR